jgi:hypothetical protein
MGIHSLTAFSSSEPLENQECLEPDIEIRGKGASTYPEDASGAVNTLPGTSKRETDDTYGNIVVRLDAKHRVINCKDNIQWILQEYTGGTWRGYSFHRNRDVLIERSRATAEDVAVLNALPEWHP